MVKPLFYLAIIFLVNFFFLFSPPPETGTAGEEWCLETYVRINRHMGFPVNCDAPTFVGAAIRPAVLFTPGYERQDRPAYILSGTILGYGLFYATYPFHSRMAEKLGEHVDARYKTKGSEGIILYGCCYLGFLLINAGILYLVFLLFEKLLHMIAGPDATRGWVFPAMLVLLIGNPLCKAFFWTAHQQLFNLLTPLLCLYGALKIQRSPNAWRTALSMSLLAGAGILFYGNFVLMAPFACFYYLKNASGNGSKISIKEIFGVLLLVLSCSLPSFCWYLLLKIHGVTLYNREIVVFREFVWIVDECKKPGFSFLSTLWTNTLQFTATLGVVAAPLILLLLTVVYVRYRKPAAGISAPTAPHLRQIGILMGSIEAAFFVFLWLMGLYASRLTTALDPLIILAIALLLFPVRAEKKLKGIVWGTVLTLYMYTVLSYGPFS